MDKMPQIGDKVKKVGGDYTFEGVVVAGFLKRNNMSVRCVVEDDRGCLHIFNYTQLEKIDEI